MTEITNKRYVLGFIFNECLTEVVLMKKKRPEWQRGLLNGVGGRVEEDESSLDAMIRECKEETGMTVLDWIHYCTMRAPMGCIDIFTARVSSVYDAVSTTDESVVISSANNTLSVVPNLAWLIPMAKYAILRKNIIAQVCYLN